MHLPYPTTPPIDLLLKQLMQWKLNKITNNHNTKEAWRSPSFASFSHLALCSLPDFVQNLFICSSPGGTRNTAFLIVQCSHCHIWFFHLLSSFHCSVLTIVFVDGLKIKMAAAGGCQATVAGRQQKVRAVIAHRWRAVRTKDALEISLAIVAILKIHHLDFIVSDFHSFSLTETFGGMSLLEWKSHIEPKGLFFDPPLNHHTIVSWLHFILGSVVLVEILALINDWVN